VVSLCWRCAGLVSREAVNASRCADLIKLGPSDTSAVTILSGNLQGCEYDIIETGPCSAILSGRWLKRPQLEDTHLLAPVSRTKVIVHFNCLEMFYRINAYFKLSRLEPQGEAQTSIVRSRRNRIQLLVHARLALKLAATKQNWNCECIEMFHYVPLLLYLCPAQSLRSTFTSLSPPNDTLSWAHSLRLPKVNGSDPFFSFYSQWASHFTEAQLTNLKNSGIVAGKDIHYQPCRLVKYSDSYETGSKIMRSKLARYRPNTCKLSSRLEGSSSVYSCYSSVFSVPVPNEVIQFQYCQSF
jgi:hypothetical protein